MKTIYKYISIIAMSVLLSSCLSDLDTQPLDSNQLVAVDVYKTADGYTGVLAKCYASLIQTGQEGGDGGDNDVSGIDEGYGGYTRGLFYLEVCSTDEIVLHSGADKGTQGILFMNWDPSNKIISYPYYRLYMAINYCNELLRECTEDKLRERGVYEDLKNDYEYYRAEARFIRAYCYTMICNLYGSGPFVDESMIVGTKPHQKTRKEIYDYALSEAEAVSTLLKAPGQNVYGRIDQVAAWFLLSRIYINSDAWVGENQFEKAYQYSKKIITDGTYPLAPDYRHIFLADNNTCREIIWPLTQDAENAQNSAGTNFYIKALVGGDMPKVDEASGQINYISGLNNQWGNARVKTQLVDLFDPADQTYSRTDQWGDAKRDKRAQFYTFGHTKETWVVGQDFKKDFKNGYACIKWKNMKKDRSLLQPSGTKYSSIDFPLFRTADAYLMAAEAILRGASGTQAEALSYVNEIRDRAYLAGAYGTATPNRIVASQLNLDIVLDERGRELHTELVRRTDLIRFNKFVSNYNWDWKGSNGMAGNYIGKDVNERYKLFPIPQDEFTVNPNLTQNPNYK